jgi:hypothetical protein
VKSEVRENLIRKLTAGETLFPGIIGYDDTVIGHEHGHFVSRNFSKDNSPGGQHLLGDNNQDIRLSWSEGYATYFASSARRRFSVANPGPTYYIDTSGAPGPGNLDFSYEIEGPSVGAIGAASEVTVQALLWDVVDGVANGTATLTRWSAVHLRLAQAGQVQVYGAAIVIGIVVAIVGILLVNP